MASYCPGRMAEYPKLKPTGFPNSSVSPCAYNSYFSPCPACRPCPTPLSAPQQRRSFLRGPRSKVTHSLGSRKVTIWEHFLELNQASNEHAKQPCHAAIGWHGYLGAAATETKLECSNTAVRAIATLQLQWGKKTSWPVIMVH